MDFSKMRHRITFLKSMGTYKNGMGENVPNYKDFITVWAFVTPKTGREYDEAQKLRAETTYNVHTRYFSNITSDMQIEYEELLIVASEVDTFGKDS